MKFSKIYPRHATIRTPLTSDREASAAELVRHFAQFREESNKAPVHLTHHGRRTHVLLSSDQYNGLLLGEGREMNGNHADPSEDLLLDLADWIDEGLILCGPDGTVRFANRVALAICGRLGKPFPALSLFEALPDISGSLMDVHIRRTLMGGEPCAADVPSPFKSGSWLRLQSFPLGDGIVLKFRDITGEVHSHRVADMKAALAEAMDGHGGIARAVISRLGIVDEANAAFKEMLGIPDKTLEGISVCDHIEGDQRPAFKRSLASVCGGKGSERISVKLVPRKGDILPVIGSISHYRGAYDADGAVLIVTPAPMKATRA